MSDPTEILRAPGRPCAAPGGGAPWRAPHSRLDLVGGARPAASAHRRRAARPAPICQPSQHNRCSRPPVANEAE